MYHLRTTGANYIAVVVTEYVDSHNGNFEVKPYYDSNEFDSAYVYLTATMNEL